MVLYIHKGEIIMWEEYRRIWLTTDRKSRIQKLDNGYYYADVWTKFENGETGWTSADGNDTPYTSFRRAKKACQKAWQDFYSKL